MSYYQTVYRSITKKVLNDNSGELENKEFIEKAVKKNIYGGFNVMYHKSYENITESSIKSNKDLKAFNWITNRFTYMQIESDITYSKCPIDISKSQFTKLLSRLVELNYIKRVSRGIYRLNPFIYVPYKANAEILQEQWLDII